MSSIFSMKICRGTVTNNLLISSATNTVQEGRGGEGLLEAIQSEFSDVCIHCNVVVDFLDLKPYWVCEYFLFFCLQ